MSNFRFCQSRLRAMTTRYAGKPGDLSQGQLYHHLGHYAINKTQATARDVMQSLRNDRISDHWSKDTPDFHGELETKKPSKGAPYLAVRETEQNGHGIQTVGQVIVDQYKGLRK